MSRRIAGQRALGDINCWTRIICDGHTGALNLSGVTSTTPEPRWPAQVARSLRFINFPSRAGGDNTLRDEIASLRGRSVVVPCRVYLVLPLSRYRILP